MGGERMQRGYMLEKGAIQGLDSTELGILKFYQATQNGAPF